MDRFAFVCAFGIAVAGCTSFDDVDEGTCGNLVLDVTEDCDGFSSFGEGTACGAPVSDNACFYTCDADADEVCPDGWGCGSDDRCRRPSGTFEPSPDSPLDFEVLDFAVGDLDGDGSSDLVGNSVTKISVRYGNTVGEFESSLDVLSSQPRGPVAFAKFDDDELLDVIVPIGAGISVFTADDDRTLEPIVYAPLSLDDVFGDNDVAVFLPLKTSLEIFEPVTPIFLIIDIHDDNNIYQGSAMTFTEQGMGLGLPDNQRASGLVGRIPVADLDNDIEEREEFALAFGGASAVYLYSSVGNSAQSTLEPFPYQTIDLGTARVLDGVHFADINGDGFLDVMISIRQMNGDPRVAVAYNNGAGAMLPPVIEPVFDRAFGEPFPIAAGQIDEGPQADFVYAEEILIGVRFQPDPGPPEVLFPIQQITTEVWTDAAIGDFNDDGANDVAVATRATDGIDMFLNSDGVFFNRFHIDTPEPAQQLRVGDFDGDVIDDLAFYETHPGEGDEVSVIFGDPSGPGEAVEMGDLGQIRCFETISASITLEFDGITDLFVLSATPQGGSRNVALLQGSSARRMTSPFTLSAETLQFPDVPFWPLVGQFDDQPALDIAALSDTPFAGDASNSERVIHLWRLPGSTGDGSINSSGVAFTELETLDDYDATCAVWANGDLDGDNRDEIIGIDGNVLCGADTPTVVVATPGDGPGPFDVSISTLAGDLRGVAAIELVDLDADGDPDLLAHFAGTIDTADGRIAVVWNDGGALDFANASLVDVADTPLLAGVGYARTTTDAAPDLVIMSAEGMYLASLDPMSRQYSEPSRIPYDAGDGRVRTGDFNNDGLDDLAYIDGAQAIVLLGVEDDPLGGKTEPVPQPSE
jgi:hypothetical protein